MGRPKKKTEDELIGEACRTLLKRCVKGKTNNISVVVQVDDLFLECKFGFKIDERTSPEFFKKPTITS